GGRKPVRVRRSRCEARCPERRRARTGTGRLMHVLVVANETVTGRKLIEAIERHIGDPDFRISVVCPVSQPQRGYVVYQDTRRAAAGRRLDRTLSTLREE